MPKDFEQKKGLFEGPLLVDGMQLSNITAIPLELKSKWIKRYTKFSVIIAHKHFLLFILNPIYR